MVEIKIKDEKILVKSEFHKDFVDGARNLKGNGLHLIGRFCLMMKN